MWFTFCVSVLHGWSQTNMGEYDIKAAYLEKFVSYIEWGPTRLGEIPTRKPNKSFVIAVLGKNSFGGALQRFFNKEKIGEKDLEIRFISNIDACLDCDMLFISASERKNLERILKKAGHYPILTVSDTKGFASDGVMINFVSQGNQIHFEINKAAAESAGIKISYRLLNLATHIYSN